MPNQSSDTTKVQLGEPVSFIGVTGLWGRDYLGTKMTHQGLQHRDNSQKLGTWSTLLSLQAAQQVGGYPLQVPQLV